MRILREGDRIKIIDVPEVGKHFLGKTGIVFQPHGTGFDEDDVMVKFDDGGTGYWKEHQLEKTGFSEN
ncbi:hypothetical protein HUU40_24140 [candidate division KSB1 bacterium]|nr:hypothetical protein [candidate division KSB1 bacterium]